MTIKKNISKSNLGQLRFNSIYQYIILNENPLRPIHCSSTVKRKNSQT